MPSSSSRYCGSTRYTSNGGNGMWTNSAIRASGSQLAQVERAAQQVIVVDPDQIARPEPLRDACREAAVDRVVGLPVARIEPHALGKGVEQRPQRAVRIALVVAAHFARRDLDRVERVAGIQLGGCARAAEPAEPAPAERAQRGIERGHEAAAGAPHLRAAPAPLDRHGQAVARDDQVIEVHGGGHRFEAYPRCQADQAMEDRCPGSTSR